MSLNTNANPLMKVTTTTNLFIVIIVTYHPFHYLILTIIITILITRLINTLTYGASNGTNGTSTTNYLQQYQ